MMIKSALLLASTATAFQISQTSTRTSSLEAARDAWKAASPYKNEVGVVAPVSIPSFSARNKGLVVLTFFQ